MWFAYTTTYFWIWVGKHSQDHVKDVDQLGVFHFMLAIWLYVPSEFKNCWTWVGVTKTGWVVIACWHISNFRLKGLPCPAGSKSLREDAQIDTTHCDFRKLGVRPSFIMFHPQENTRIQSRFAIKSHQNSVQIQSLQSSWQSELLAWQFATQKSCSSTCSSPSVCPVISTQNSCAWIT